MKESASVGAAGSRALIGKKVLQSPLQDVRGGARPTFHSAELTVNVRGGGAANRVPDRGWGQT